MRIALLIPHFVLALRGLSQGEVWIIIILYLGVPLLNTSVLFYARVIALLCLPAAKHEQQDNLNDDDDVRNDAKSKYSN